MDDPAGAHMLSKIVERLKVNKLVKAIERDPLRGPALTLLRDVLNDKRQGLAKNFSEEGKQRLTAECLTDIDNVLAQSNPVQAVRMRTIEFMLLSAKFDVLVMQPPTIFQGLSGELKPRIPDLARSDKELGDFFYGLDEPMDSFDKMWDAVLMRYWVMNLYVNAYNTVRCALGDYQADKTKDWLRPCYISFCIWHENTYRTSLALPSVISGENCDMRALMHSTWMNRAEEGEKFLRRSWEQSWEECFGEQSPYAGLAL
ncbi:hypothetical protein ACW9YV_07835 [Paraburkholderia strydomiana]